MNQQGLQLLRAVIQRDASLTDAVNAGDCNAIAAGMNTWMPADMQLAPVDVFQAMKGAEGFSLPTHNAEVLRARIDAEPTLFSARLNAAMRGAAGDGAIQTIVNELNLSPDPREHVTIADVEAAMGIGVVTQPGAIAAGAGTLVGVSRIG